MSTRQEYVDDIKSTFSTIGRSFTMAWLAANLPFTQLPIIKSMVNYLVGLIWKDAADAAEFQVFMLYIDTRVGQQGSEFEKAAQENRIAQLSGTPEEKARAEAALKDKSRALIALKL